MAEEPKKLIVDDDWKEQARRDKERLAQQEAQTRHGPPPQAAFLDLVNLLAVQAMVGLGAMVGPGGERIPPSLDAAQHFIDLLQVLQDKTRNNLTADEKQILDQIMRDLRLRFVELVTAAAAPPVDKPPPTA